MRIGLTPKNPFISPGNCLNKASLGEKKSSRDAVDPSSNIAFPAEKQVCIELKIWNLV
jgi:hypothetical protein